jgi:hypothetical protein
MIRTLNTRLCCLILGIILSVVYLQSKVERPELFQDTALAEENGTLTVYLPLALNNHPLKTVFGAEMNPISDENGLEMMSLAESSWVRRNGVLWSAVEPVQGSGYDWSVLASLEEDLLLARSHDMEVVLIVRSTPEWARVPAYNYACGPIAASALPAFGNFMHALVQRYGSAPYYVKYFEIWNEPDVDPVYVNGLSPWGCMGDLRDTEYYGGQYFATVLQAAYPMVKAANPEAQVVVGGLLLICNPNDPPEFDPENECTPSKYLEGILVAGGANYFDGVSFHSYDYFTVNANYPNGIYGNPLWNTGASGNTLYGELKPGLVAKAHFLRDLLTAYSAGDKFLINTETSLLCGGPSDPPGGPGCEAISTSPFEKTKAAYVVQSYASAIAEGLLANIWFTPLGWRNSGLLYPDLTPRPGYDAYVLARDTLKNALFLHEVSEFSDNLVFGYEFLVGVKKIWVLWTLDGKSHSITLPALPEAAWEELGNPVDFGSGTLTIGEMKTVYVDWGP